MGLEVSDAQAMPSVALSSSCLSQLLLQYPGCQLATMLSVMVKMDEASEPEASPGETFFFIRIAVLKVSLPSSRNYFMSLESLHEAVA